MTLQSRAIERLTDLKYWVREWRNTKDWNPQLFTKPWMNQEKAHELARKGAKIAYDEMSKRVRLQVAAFSKHVQL